MLISDPTLHLHVTIFNLSKICKYANYLPALTLLPPFRCDGVRSTLGASCFFGPQVFFTIQFIHLLGKRLNTTYWFLVHSRLPSLLLSLLVPLPDSGKVMSHGANKLHMPYLTISIYCSYPISGKSINCIENPINS